MHGVDEDSEVGPGQSEPDPRPDLHGGRYCPHPVHRRVLEPWLSQRKYVFRPSLKFLDPAPYIRSIKIKQCLIIVGKLNIFRSTL